jgi:uncharacterized membrane protein YozB (DUF420 family)
MNRAWRILSAVHLQNISFKVIVKMCTRDKWACNSIFNKMNVIIVSFAVLFLLVGFMWKAGELTSLCPNDNV